MPIKIFKIKYNQGFTLLEVALSLAIFGVLSISIYQIVNQVQDSNILFLKRSNRLKELQRALIIMDNDFRQIALRQFRTNGKQTNSPLLLDYNKKSLLFTRLGWHNPEQKFPRGEITKVKYRFQNNILERIWWQYPDTPEGISGEITPILTGVLLFDIKLYDGKTWQTKWESLTSLPKAILIIFKLIDYGRIEKIYLTVDSNFNKESI
nr:type II secretion system minor pseudopilin GspJ [Candidatus Photodesmus katoptron]